MKAAWGYLKYFPPGLLTWIKQNSSPRLRLWIRETLGGSYKTIPDRVQTVPDGRRFHIGPDLIYWPIYTGVGFEPEATSVLRRLLRSDDVVVDVGANFGWYTTLFAQLAPEGKIHAFEPVPDTYGRLLENLALNEMSGRITAVQAAVSDAPGTCQIFTFEKGSGYASLSSLGEKSYRAIEVPKISLDRYLAENSIARVDFLKCDTEGSELMVLKGARALLESAGAPMIFIELNDATFSAFGYVKEDIRRTLCGHGYDRFYEVVSAHGLRQLSTPQAFGLAGYALCAKGDAVTQRLAGSGIEIQ